MDRIFSELKDQVREKEELAILLVREKEELVSRKHQELLQFQTEAERKYHHERESKLAAIMKLKESKKAQERYANIQLNKLREEMSSMIPQRDYKILLSEVEALREENKEQKAQIKRLQDSVIDAPWEVSIQRSF